MATPAFRSRKCSSGPRAGPTNDRRARLPSGDVARQLARPPGAAAASAEVPGRRHRGLRVHLVLLSPADAILAGGHGAWKSAVPATDVIAGAPGSRGARPRGHRVAGAGEAGPR